MRKIFAVLVVAISLLNLSAMARSPDANAAPAAARKASPVADLSYLKKWEGQSPVFDMKSFRQRPEGSRFWDDPNVLAVMRRSLPEEIITKVTKGWNKAEEPNVSDNIERRGNILYAFTCRAHFCSTDAARLYFNLEKKSVQVCWTELNSKTKEQTDFWFSTKVKRLGSDACLRNDRFAAYDAFADKNF